MSRPDPTAHRLVFDAARCDGFGMCSVVFPELISLDPWGFAHVERRALDDLRSLRRAVRAVGCCPRAALSLEEVGAAASSQVRM